MGVYIVFIDNYPSLPDNAGIITGERFELYNHKKDE